jgi:hypothetical protein
MKYIFAFLALLFTTFTCAAENLELTVQEPYINIHTGAGRGYPINYVAEQGEQIIVIKRHASWYLVQLTSDVSGWVHQDEIAQTITPDGNQFQLAQQNLQGFAARQFEVGVDLGSIEGVTSQGVNLGWQFTPNFTLSLDYQQALGSVAKNQIAAISIQHSIFPSARFSPYIGIGAGQIWTTPRSPVIGGGDETRTSDTLVAAIGLRTYLARNFVLTSEYKQYLALTERDQTEELEQWKLGLTVFF